MIIISLNTEFHVRIGLQYRRLACVIGTQWCIAVMNEGLKWRNDLLLVRVEVDRKCEKETGTKDTAGEQH